MILLLGERLLGESRSAWATLRPSHLGYHSSSIVSFSIFFPSFFVLASLQTASYYL